ncbi:serine/threonine-protein kinase [Sinosporangium siamense]|uniref:serine/threonine-protein kinase n=1 Tax=Sinosporangium siamense TaxID=1367973 RepID=UPI001951CCE6|nr:serine/threonine-protein kinase [Sinosporangium siamense]
MSKLGRVGPYTLLERLGRGGMGEVYLAQSKKGDPVALKMLRDTLDSDPDARLRLKREVQALRRVESPYVTRVLGADLDCDRPYLVMQHIEGDTLLDVVRRDGPLSGTELLVLAQAMAAALAIVHAAGVIHRDLKPGNVLMGTEGPVLIDFGIAQLMDATRLTMTGTFLGTPGYAAPELFADEQVAEPADVHAWAATVAFAATGRPTFGGGTAEAQMYAVLNGKADLAGVPAALLPLVRAALHREPVKRPTAAVLADRLTRLVRVADPAHRRQDDTAAGRGRVAAAPPAKATAARNGSPRSGSTSTVPPKSVPPKSVPPKSGPSKSGPKSVPPKAAVPKSAASKSVPPKAAVQRAPSPKGASAQAAVAVSADDTPRPRRRRRPEAGADGVRRRRRAGADGQVASHVGALPAGNTTLMTLAVLAVPCVVAMVVWPVATFAVTALFGTLTRATWMGHWMVRKRRSARVRLLLRVVGFPASLAASLVTAIAWPGVPAALAAGATLWLTSGAQVHHAWWVESPVPVTVAGVVFGIVFGAIIGRELERVGPRLPELRRDGLRAFAVLGGFVAVCAVAVRVVALGF